MVFYQQVCAEASRVLELGCGGGRVLAPLAQSGVKAVGLELSRDMMNRARAACANLPNTDVIQGDMREFSLGEVFDRIVIPYNGIYCLLSETDVVRCLRAVKRHLCPTGLLVFDAYTVGGSAQELSLDHEIDDEWERVATVQVANVPYDVFERCEWNLETQRCDAFYAYRAEGADPKYQYQVPQRYLSSEQIEPLLHKAGLELIVMHGDFDQSVFDEESERLIVTAALPAG